jgi:hypothetical protein
MDSDGRRHPYEVLDYHGIPDAPVEIDAEIVPLIRAIWALGFDTELSCQDDDGRVWVELPGKHAQRLLNVIAGEDGELRANILRLVPVEIGPDGFYAHQEAHSWDLQTVALRDCGGEPDVWLSIGVRFPREQLRAVVAALEAIGVLRVEMAEYLTVPEPKITRLLDQAKRDRRWAA